MKEPLAFVLIITSQNGVCEIIDYRFAHLYSILHIRIENISAYIIYIYNICEICVFLFCRSLFFWFV